MSYYFTQLLTELFILLNIALFLIIYCMLDAIIKLRKKQKEGK